MPGGGRGGTAAARAGGSGRGRRGEGRQPSAPFGGRRVLGERAGRFRTLLPQSNPRATGAVPPPFSWHHAAPTALPTGTCENSARANPRGAPEIPSMPARPVVAIFTRGL